VYVAPIEEPVEGSYAKRKRTALTREEAVAYIAGDDPRPLLVLRECKVCNGTDDALLKGGVDNEKTFLLSRWFHCVKLPVDVMEEDHPFHNMFTLEQPEHLFVCSIDGSNHDPLESQTSRTELWESMRDLLSLEYKSNPDSSLKQIAKLLDKMDVVDQRIGELAARRNDVLEEDGPESKKLKKIDRKIAEAEQERDEMRGEVIKASTLELKRQQVRAKASEETARAGN
jgi:hypothetical protein